MSVGLRGIVDKYRVYIHFYEVEPDASGTRFKDVYLDLTVSVHSCSRVVGYVETYVIMLNIKGVTTRNALSHIVVIQRQDLLCVTMPRGVYPLTAHRCKSARFLEFGKAGDVVV